MRTVTNEELQAWSEDEPPPDVNRLRSLVLRGDAIKSLPAPEPLIDGLLDIDSLAAVFGPSGTAKTFLATSWGLSVTTGSWWFGRRVRQGKALYVIAESPSGLGPRVDAWERHERVTMTGDLHWLPSPVNLLNPNDVSDLCELAAEEHYVLVVVDTLAMSMIGGNENDSRDMGRVVGALHSIRRASGACVLIVHHTGKDLTAGARGHSSLKGALDTELEVRGGDGTVTLTVSKQRNHVEGDPVWLRLSPVGESAVLTTRTSDDGELPRRAQEVLEVLAAIEIDGGVSSSMWAKSCDVPDRTFWRIRKGLLDTGLVVNIGTDKQPRYLTTATATATANHCHGSDREVLPATATPLRGGSGSDGDTALQSSDAGDSGDTLPDLPSVRYDEGGAGW